MVKVLHVNYSDIKGGAAIGVNRFHQALLKSGIDSKILVCDKNSNDDKVLGPSSTIELFLNQLKISISRYIKRKLIRTENKETFSFNFFNTKILNKINKQDVDIVHLHWIGNEMISISQLKKIKKPILWSFWDMWPICGAEHHSYDDRYINGYTKLNRPLNERGIDLNRIIWNHKRKNLNFDYTITSPSKWFFDIVKKSKLHKDKKVIHLPLNIDTSIWKPRDIKYSKDFFNLDNDKKILLFGSATSTNERKGFNFLIKLFKKKKFNNCMLLIFGEKPKNLDQLNIDYKYVGRINDIYSLNMLYSLSDILLMPSQIELFGQIGMEANACGTPCVIFEDTGATDYVEHLKTGYISKHLDLDDYTHGINWLIEDQNQYKTISQNCREYICKNFGNEIISKKLIDIYSKIKN